MFWFLATWCPSCIKGKEILRDNNQKLKDVDVIAVKTYGNAGHSGPSISEFAQDVPATLDYDNWIWGNATERTTRVYNPQNYADIYYLIDEKGTIQHVDGVPSATLDEIIGFAQD